MKVCPVSMWRARARNGRRARAFGALFALAAHASPLAAQILPDDSANAPQSAANPGTQGSGGQGASGPAAGGGAAAAAGAGGGFSPVVITTPTPSAADGRSLSPVTRPDAEGGATGPLYVKPGPVAGQFELLQHPPSPTSEFEKFVRQSLGRPLPRYGSALVLDRGRGFTTAPTTTVPPDYRLNPGDELLIGVTGAAEANLRVVLDSEGRIFIPKVGAINLAGVRYGDLAADLSRRFADQFKKVRLSVVISRLHGLNIYVTGYAVSPGAYTVSSLSTMVDAVLAAGGPASGGSFRFIQLRRNGELIATLDLYDLLLGGDKSHDAVLQNEDVLNIAPVGAEVAVSGSVNAEAIFEAKPGETLGDLIRYAGGPTSLADDTRVLISRLADLDAMGWRQLDFAKARAFPAERGDIVRVLTLADVARPLERQAILATIEGEVDRPGRYYLKPGSTIADLLATAGGLTSGAFVFGTELDRDSVRSQQQASFDKAIANLELAAVAAPLQSQNGTADRAAAGAARGQAALAVIDKLKERKPDGRLVMDLPYGVEALPGALGLENNDRLFVPPRPRTVGVFGAIYQPGSFAFVPATRLGDYLKLSGGPQKIADRGDIFVVRANGAVLSSRQAHDFASRPALPGDVIFVPVRTSRTAFEKLLDVGLLVYEFGIGALTLKALGA